MSKVLTFSRFFPAYHPRKGEPTFFVEKIFTDLFNQHLIDNRNMDEPLLEEEIKNFYTKTYEGKGHTIRAGNRWKAGDWFSPRVWSGKPYQSKQIIIAPCIKIKNVWDFRVDKEGLFFINDKWIDVTSSDIPVNDGLSSDDFLGWFPVKEFKGQILCWNENINYT